MASTTRKKQTVKKEDKPIIISEPVEQKKLTSLSSSDLLSCETLSRDVQLARMILSVEEQALRNMSLEYKNLEYRIESQKRLMQHKQQEYDNIKKRYISFMLEMWPKYGIEYKEGIGYDTVSGEIKI